MAQKPLLIKKIRPLRQKLSWWRGRGEKIALVPTMGALHEGHFSLMKRAKKLADRVVVSIFVNPTQFGPHEDFDAYPRNMKGDRAKLAKLDVDLIFAPSLTEIYPADFSTEIRIKGIGGGLCATSRPDHFPAVATIVNKLFMQCQPDYAVFGKKDYQQYLLIKQMVRDLDIDMKIVGAPIVREADGLALSSRNAYLSAADRARAPVLYGTLKELRKKLQSKKGARFGRPLAQAKRDLTAAGFKLDYLELRHSETLKPFKDTIDRPARLLVAAYLGSTRLIDNLAFSTSYK